MSDAAFTVVGEVSAPDPCLYEQTVRPWELANTPLEPGVFGYRMHYMQTPAVTFYREQFDLACRVQGLSPPNVFVFSVPLRLGTRSNYWNAPLHESAFPAMLPGGLDAELSAGQDHLVVLVDFSLLHRHSRRTLRWTEARSIESPTTCWKGSSEELRQLAANTTL